MKVILLKDVRNVGMHGTIKEVADGFARNYLFAHKLAEPATEEKIAAFNAAAAAREAEARKAAEQLDTKVQSLNGKTVSLAVRATDKGGLFKAVGPADIAKAIRAEHSLEIPEESVVLSQPIKTVGEHALLLQSKSHKVSFGVVVTAA